MAHGKFRQFIDHRHDHFLKLSHRWWFYLKSYVGGDEYINHSWDLFNDVSPKRILLRAKDLSFLHRFGRENQDDFIHRIARSYFLNYCRTIINIYKNHISRKGVDRTPTPAKDPDIVEFRLDADGGGTNLNDFLLEQVLPLNQIYGWQAVLVDMPLGDLTNKTEADRKAAGMKPFAKIIPPFNLVDWQVTDNKFDWVKIESFDLVKFDDPKEEQEKKQDRTFTVWTKTHWERFNDNGKSLKRQEHKLGIVPVIVAFNERSFIYEWPIGLSAINDISDLNREIYNMSSLLQEFLYKQCFPQMVLDEESIGKIIELGNSNAIPMNKDMFTPAYLSPPVDPAKFINDVIQRLIQEIYRQALVRDTSVEIGQAESGISKAFDFHDSQQNIARKSQNMEMFEIELTQLAMKWLGKDVKADELGVKWPQEFDIKTINEEIMDAIEIFKSDLGSITLNRQIAKTLVPKLVQDDNLIKTIGDELDATDPGLDLKDRMEMVRMNAISILDVVRTQNPGKEEKELIEILEKNIEANKKFVQALTKPTNGFDNEAKIKDRLKDKGITVEE